KPDPSHFGPISTMVLRCCGQQDGRELFRVAQYTAAWFDYQPTNPKHGKVIAPPVAADVVIAESQASLIASAKRWTGQDAANNRPFTFEVGPADALEAVGHYHPLLVRGVDGPVRHYYKITIVDDVRAF